MSELPVRDEGPPKANFLRRWLRLSHRLLVAREISRHARYFDECLQLSPRFDDDGLLLQAIDCRRKRNVVSTAALPDLRRASPEQRTLILLNGILNYHLDIQGLLSEIKTRLNRTSRITIVAYNPYLRWFYALANFIGVRKGELPGTFLTHTDLRNLTHLSGYEITRLRGAAYLPLNLPILTPLIESILRAIPGFKRFALTNLITLRPVIPEAAPPLLSVVIPARNEKGNIEAALKRLQNWQSEHGPLEVVFVEGNSSDGTWEEIQRVLPLYASSFQKLSAYKQAGKGKNDAVREGFKHCIGTLLTILDADLTMPPEMLHRFYDAYVTGKADFINGSRLLYPMEGQAMRTLNRLGNVFFAKSLSYVLDRPLSDSLCGTKLFSRTDYARIQAWRADFGDFDPFGDFELLFPASILALGTIDVPVRYLARTYGETNISRFSHGWMLLRMTVIGLFRVKLR